MGSKAKSVAAHQINGLEALWESCFLFTHTQTAAAYNKTALGYFLIED